MIWINTLLYTLVKLLRYILKCNRFGMTTLRVFVKIISTPDENLFPKRLSGAPLHTLSSVAEGGCCSISCSSRYLEGKNSDIYQGELQLKKKKHVTKKLFSYI